MQCYMITISRHLALFLQILPTFEMINVFVCLFTVCHVQYMESSIMPCLYFFISYEGQDHGHWSKKMWVSTLALTVTKRMTQGINFSGLQLLICKVDVYLPQEIGARIKE